MIHIYEADYNFLIGAVWREATQHVQKLGKINQGQYRGCPGRDCTSVTYLEELRRDISILTQSAYTNFDNDAASCYDRIFMSVASLSGKKIWSTQKGSVRTCINSKRSQIQIKIII